MLLKYRDVDLPTLGGLLIVESVVPLMAASAAVVAVIAGLEAGLFVASGLVVTTSATVAWHRRCVATRPRELDDDEVMVAVVEAMMDGLPARDR
jgi:hypothetical protein